MFPRSLYPACKTKLQIFSRSSPFQIDASHRSRALVLVLRVHAVKLVSQYLETGESNFIKTIIRKLDITINLVTEVFSCHAVELNGMKENKLESQRG